MDVVGRLGSLGSLGAYGAYGAYGPGARTLDSTANPNLQASQ